MLAGALAAMAPLALAAIGGLFTELSGMLNIALEGLITIGAFAGALAASATGSLAAGMAAGAAAAMALSLAYAFASLKLKSNEFVAGLATNLFASGMAAVLSQTAFSTKAVVRLELPEFAAPLAGLRLGGMPLGELPFLGELAFSQNIAVMLSWLAVPAAWLVIMKTPFGMRLRATGANSQAIKALGRSPDAYRLAAILVSAALSGLAGAYLALNLSAYVPNISAGRGWIALVAIYLGGRKPAGVLAACFAFALAESFSNHAQGFSGALRIPPEAILAIPYLATLAALVAGAGLRKGAARRAGSSRR